jgi:hypothetical protein
VIVADAASTGAVFPLTQKTHRIDSRFFSIQSPQNTL